METLPKKRYNDDHLRQTHSWSNNEQMRYNYPRETKVYQTNKVTPNHYSNNLNQANGEYLTRNFPRQYGAYRQERRKTNPKNNRGALDERTSYARM